MSNLVGKIGSGGGLLWSRVTSRDLKGAFGGAPVGYSTKLAQV